MLPNPNHLVRKQTSVSGVKTLCALYAHHPYVCSINVVSHSLDNNIAREHNPTSNYVWHHNVIRKTNKLNKNIILRRDGWNAATGEHLYGLLSLTQQRTRTTCLFVLFFTFIFFSVCCCQIISLQRSSKFHLPIFSCQSFLSPAHFPSLLFNHSIHQSIYFFPLCL